MLYALKDSDGKLQKQMLKHVSPEVIKTMAEIAINILNGNIALDGAVKKRLAVYKKELRALACLKRKLSSKRKILVQKGGVFLPTFLGTVLSGLIGSYLSSQK